MTAVAQVEAMVEGLIGAPGPGVEEGVPGTNVMAVANGLTLPR